MSREHLQRLGYKLIQDDMVACRACGWTFEAIPGDEAAGIRTGRAHRATHGTPLSELFAAAVNSGYAQRVQLFKGAAE